MNSEAFFATEYDRAQCDIGVVHAGFGAFHRAHQAVYIDDYMQLSGDLRWGIAAVNLRASEAKSFRKASEAKQGYLLKSIAPDGGAEFRAVRSHVAFVDASSALEDALALFERPSVSMLSITVTESGYSFADDWSLNLAAPEIVHDLTQGSAETIYGFMRHALSRRKNSNAMPMTVLCCDNIRDNGKVLERAFHSFLQSAGEKALSDWVRANVSFPCSMVDRITPRATASLEAEVQGLFPAYSANPIHAEDFVQWVLEDRFSGSVPDLARAGVQVVSDVTPYEEAKIRILNGGHTGLTYMGALAGHMTFDAAMIDPKLRQHFDAWEEEVLAGLPDLIPLDTGDYLREIALRFENKGIADQLERICMDGYSKMAIYVRPTLRACLAKDIKPSAGYDCVASWVVYARRFKDGVATVPYHEPMWDDLEALLDVGEEAKLAREARLWGDLPSEYPQFVPDLVQAIKRMEQTWQA